MDQEIKHYGTLEKSGRYPWGSGENPYQRLTNFRGTVLALRKQGVPYTKIAEGMGIKTTQLRARISIANTEIRAADVARAEELRAKGHSPTGIGKKMGINESSVRSLLDPGIKARQNITQNTADMLKQNVDDHKYVDIGTGVERHLGISAGRLNTAVALLVEQGHKVEYVDVEQLGSPGNFTTIKVLVKEDTPYKELWKNQAEIKSVASYSEDGGRSYRGLEPVKSVDRSRVKIIYRDEGGADKDGVIELRSGVDDIDLGEARYAQVRVGVDDKYYMKGMAIRGIDKFPKGVDILYHTTKPKGAPDEKVFKGIEADPDNPFGSTVRQKHYIDKDGKEQLSTLNIMGSKPGSGEEGHWNEWSKTISSQVLSKQDPKLAKRQLDRGYDESVETYNEISNLTNPVIKKHLLMKQADQFDADAGHLKAAALPRQRNQILLPVPDMPKGEVYAPNYRSGEQVVLLRHPHGGKFEIPMLTVNNKHPRAKKYIGESQDAIGINSEVAQQLSGADFDGDTVIVIPNSKRVGIKYSPPLKELQNFDPQIAYPYQEGMAVMTEKSKGRFMGDISNLITDMTIKGASDSEIARAVKHSMVVIDSAKHELNYKASQKENGIPQLKKKYQGATNAGASTIVSLSRSEERVPYRHPTTPDPKTGAKRYRYSPESYTNKAGKVVERTTRSRKMDEAKDAMELSSGTVMENIYADYANKHKALANQARKEAIATKPFAYNSNAKKVYEKEVEALDAKVNVALMNAPVERYAQLLANSVVKLKRQESPGLTNDDVKKLKQQTLEEMRRRVGAERQVIDEITTQEWEAIQAGAISPSKLTSIIVNMDDALLKELSMPRVKQGITSSQIGRIKAMLNSGYPQADIADALGLSVSTVLEYA